MINRKGILQIEKAIAESFINLGSLVSIRGQSDKEGWEGD